MADKRVPIRILVVEDNPTDALLLEDSLHEVSLAHFETIRVERLGQAVARLAAEDFDVVLLDLTLPDSQGPDTLVGLRLCQPDVPVVVLTGLEDEAVGMQAVQLGAQDFLVKGHCPAALLGRSILYAIERHQSALALRDSEARLSGLINSVMDAIITVDENQRISLFNPAAQRTFGCEEWRVLGKTPERLVPQRFRSAQAGEQRLFGQIDLTRWKMGKVGQIYGLRADGTEFPMETSISRAEVAGQKFFTLILRDVSERKRAEEALDRTQRILAQAEQLAHVGAWECEIADHEAPEEGLLHWSDETCRIFGYDPGTIEVSYSVFLGHVHEGDRSCVRTAFRHAVASRASYSIEYSIFRRDGAERRVVQHADVLLDAGGIPKRVVGAIQDITERKQAEEDRELLLMREQLARGEAEAASRTKDEFLATVSHELRTPLNSILGWATMLRTGPIQDVIAPRALETIERNARLQARLIDDLLDMSRIISGKLRISVQPINVAQIVQAAWDSVRPAADAKEIQLKLEIDPAAEQIRADPTRLQQILWNLLSNSIKFTPLGGSIQVRICSQDAMAEISVTDTGEGINKEFLPFVFDRFKQADGSITRKHGGLGLGLAIARHLTEMHGGFITAESEGEGKGATFRVKLPLAPAVPAPTDTTGPFPAAEDLLEPMERSGSIAESSTAPDTRKLAGVRVLAMDDDRDTREMLRVVLNQYGADVATAASARQAMDVVSGWKPDVLVCDISMNGEDGFQFMENFRKLGPEKGGSAPAIALTAHVESETRERALGAGYHTLVPKPMDSQELVAVIAELTGRAGQSAAANC